MTEGEPQKGQYHPFRIRPCSLDDIEAMLAAINESTQVYKDFLPAAAHHEPTMTREELRRELGRISFFVAETADAEIIGVMGCEEVHDAVLLRHGYIRPGWQRRGIGSALLRHCESLPTKATRWIAGTYATNRAALAFCEKHGYRPDPDSDATLRFYYDIPEVQREHSVALTKVITDTKG